MSLLNRNDAFTIIWKIHNFSMCPEVKISEPTLYTPTLIVDKLDNTKWYLSLLSKVDNGDKYLLCQLYREESLNIPLSISISYSIELISIDSSELSSKISHRVFKENDFVEFLFGKLNVIYNKKDILLPSDILTVQCCMWKDKTVEVVTSYSENRRLTDISNFRTWTESHRILGKDEFGAITLQVGEQSFCAHKFVLSASCTYFRNRFRYDLKEQTIEISNCEAGTLEKLLKYLYLGVLEEMPHEDLVKLYYAAVKFQVERLKRQCSLKLKASLEVSNVCDVLTIADLHNDRFLKTTVEEFISEYANEIFHSSKWKNLMKCRPMLTGDIMHKVLTNKNSL